MQESESAIMNLRLPEWRNGRRGGLKNRCRKTCEFKSRLGHQLSIKLPSGELFLLQTLSCSQVFPDERKIIDGTLRNIANFQERSDALHSYKQARHDAQAERGTEGKGAILCEDAKAHAQHHPGQRSDEERRESLLEIEE